MESHKGGAGKKVPDKYCYGACQRRVPKTSFNDYQVGLSGGKYPRCKTCIAQKVQGTNPGASTAPPASEQVLPSSSMLPSSSIPGQVRGSAGRKSRTMRAPV